MFKHLLGSWSCGVSSSEWSGTGTTYFIYSTTTAHYQSPPYHCHSMHTIINAYNHKCIHISSDVVIHVLPCTYIDMTVFMSLEGLLARQWVAGDSQPHTLLSRSVLENCARQEMCNHHSLLPTQQGQNPFHVVHSPHLTHTIFFVYIQVPEHVRL